MDKEKLLLELNNQIEAIKAHISRLKRNERNIHMLDVDMLRKKTIELYEMVSELEQLVHNSSTAKTNKIPEIIPPTIETNVAEPSVIEEDVVVNGIEAETKKAIIENKPKAEKLEIIEEDVTIEEIVIPKTVTPILEEIPVIEPELIPELVKITPPPVEEKVQEPILADIVEPDKNDIVELDKSQPQQTTYDLFSGNSDNVVAEKYHAKEEQSIGDKMQKSQILNIREAIGINEKFLFINELFNGDLGRYNKILDDINDLATKQGVDTYLFELKIQFQWADDSEAYVKLKELLERKFV